MSRSKASGYSLTNKDASIVLGMVARGDRDHDIAAYFGVNQGRIAEVKSGSHGTVSAAPAAELPPRGAPGVKGRRLRASVRKVIELLETGGAGAVEEASKVLKEAAQRYDAPEA
jgi:hypothetical protein